MKKKILILGANPYKDLDLPQEIQELKDAIQESHEDEKFQIDFVFSGMRIK